MISIPIARATARQRGLTAATAAVAAVLVLLALFRSGEEWGAEAFSGFSGLWFQLLTILLGAGLLAEEVESGHAQLVLLRPLTRAEWVSGRFSGAGFVLCVVGTAAWAAAFASALARGQTIHPVGRMAVLPLELVHGLAWLAVFTAVGAVARGWTNVGLVVAAWVGWKLIKLALPQLLHRPDLATVFETIDQFYGPQDSIGIARQLDAGETLKPSPALWNLFGMAAAWLGTVELFNRRELARRRP
jgi:hypothetical protein